MPTAELLEALPDKTVLGTVPPALRGLAYDSRKVAPGELFVAIPGLKQDGRRFIGHALGRGAAVELLSAGVESATLMPRMQGLSFRQALEVLAPLDVRLEVTGRGIVVSQAPPPGAPLPAGATCSLALASPAARP